MVFDERNERGRERESDGFEEKEREKLQLLKPLMCIAHEHSTSVTLNYCHLLLYAATPARMHHACKKS